MPNKQTNKQTNKHRYNIHALLKKKGIIVRARKREVLVYEDTPLLKGMLILRDKYGYTLQYTIK